MGGPLSLDRLQRQLQDIYELQVPEDVGDFLITDPRIAELLCGEPGPSGCRERLLLRQEAGALALSLYVDADVIDGLTCDAGPGATTIADLDRFCVALEGVSHFLYMVWHAARERSVSLLEMELQAEVDKYVLIRELLAVARPRAPAPGLIPRLFRPLGYHRYLGAVEQRRYRVANLCAERYCRRLEGRYYDGTPRRGELLNELRRFYRLPGRDKVRETARLH